ncbi:hypothetical protein B0H21DRAFT_117343 [Amylocystis lapponica]|nr:hypothetical protein B0H21DRAFT_117343 [Amylocystis lapponica]
MAPPSTHTGVATTAITPTSSSSRSRTQASRKRPNATADDAAYHASASVSASAGVGAGSKRTAVDRAEGEPRVKRKRVDGGAATNVSAGIGAAGGSAVTSAARRERVDGDARHYRINFATLPTDALYRYLVHFDLVPEVDPSPLVADDPPAPSSLLRPRSHAHRHASTASPGPSHHITPANRPRREAVGRRRSARLVEDEQGPDMSTLPVLADIEDVRATLAAVAQRHFREHAVPEVDTLASFMCAVKAKDY